MNHKLSEDISEPLENLQSGLSFILNAIWWFVVRGSWFVVVVFYVPTVLQYRNFLKILSEDFELELELIQTHMAQKPMLRAEVGMRVRCANKASAE